MCVCVCNGTNEMPVTSRGYVTKCAATALLLMLITPQALAATHADAGQEGSEPTAEYDLDELLRTETTLVDALRHYVDMLEAKIAIIKSKTLAIKSINDAALNNTDKYVNNPINALTLIKRFISDWPKLRDYAASAVDADELVAEITANAATLQFPSEEDLDEAAANLLRIQDIYKLEPQLLAVGEVNGVKFGSEMSWSDCLEIGRKSDQNGDYAIARFWMETALGKLPTAANATDEGSNVTAAKTRATLVSHGESVEARLEILQALLQTERNAGNLGAALDVINELLVIRPKQKKLRQQKAKIEAELQKPAKKLKKLNKLTEKTKKQKQTDKSEEELLIEEICRAGTTPATDSGNNNMLLASDSRKYCTLAYGNLPQLLLQPLRVEYLSLDPYIVIYHNVLRTAQMEGLRALLEERSTYDSEVGDMVENLQFTQLAQQKLRHINQQLERITGHASDLFDSWQAQGRNYEDLSDFEVLVQRRTPRPVAAHVLFNLNMAKLGGAIVYPQLELSVQVPTTSLLYWSNLNEFQEEDYRTKQYVCPVIAGTQIMVYTSIRSR